MNEARLVEAALQMKVILLQRLKNSSLCEGYPGVTSATCLL